MRPRPDSATCGPCACTKPSSQIGAYMALSPHIVRSVFSHLFSIFASSRSLWANSIPPPALIRARNRGSASAWARSCSKRQGSLRWGTVSIRNSFPAVCPVRDPLLINPAIQLLGGVGRRQVSRYEPARRWRSRRGCGRRGGRRLGNGRNPYPSVGHRHAVALKTGAPADVAHLSLDGWGHGQLRLRLVGWRGHVDRLRVVHRIRVGIGVVRVGERRTDEDPPDEGGTEAAAEAMEAAAVEPSMMEAATLEPAAGATLETTPAPP